MSTKKYKRSKSKTKKNNKTNKYTKYTHTLKYCCLDRKVKSQSNTQCVTINTNLNLDTTTNPNPKYAITTLLFGGDSYLPGILLLGSSIRKLMSKEYKKYITLCCMVTNDVS